MNKPRAAFIGRFQPAHLGHEWLIRQKLDKGIPVLILVRDVPPDEKNPYTTSDTVDMLRTAFKGEDVIVQVIPDIESVNYGRGVGYEINEFIPPEDVEHISATEIRNLIKTGNASWKKKVNPYVAEWLEKYYARRACIWLTGLSGSGKSTLANEMSRILTERGIKSTILDGDILRQSACKDLGFSKEDRDINIDRAGAIAAYLAKEQVVICAFISPYREARDRIRKKIDNFHEIELTVPLEVLKRRDVKGLYKKAEEDPSFELTGVHENAPYEYATAVPGEKLKTMVYVPTEGKINEDAYQLLRQTIGLLFI